MNRVIVGFETSGMIRNALRAVGVDAVWVDVLPSEDGSPFHIIGDAYEVAESEWFAFGVFHPPCTYLTGSAAWAFTDGPYHQRVKTGTVVGQARRDARDAALADVRRLMALPYPKAIENPVGAIGTYIRRPDQIIQPYEFGDDASKKTCLWLDRLPRLTRTGWVEPRMVCGCGFSFREDLGLFGCANCLGERGPAKPRWGNQTDSGQNRLSPGADRWKERSRTYPGIAQAAATQWGTYAMESAA